MPYTADPANVPTDAVRLTIGDTDPAAPEFADGELAYFLALASGDVLSAAIQALTSLQAKYAGAVNESVGSVSISSGSRAGGYGEMLQQLRRRAATEGAGPWAGGISRADKALRRLDPDRVAPLFNRSMLQSQETQTSATEGQADGGGRLPGPNTLEPSGG